MNFCRIVSILLLVALFAGCTKGVPDIVKSPETAGDQIDGSIPLANKRVVILKNSIGPAMLKWGGVKDSIRWGLSRQVTGENSRDAAALLGSIGLFAESNGDTVRFYVQAPTGITRFTFSTLVSLGVPYDSMAYIIDGVQGTTTVADLGANLRIRNVHGVTVKRLNASCDIVSSDGGVTTEVALPPDGFCYITAVKGTITLKVPTNTSANVTARTTHGSISYSNLTFTGLNQQTGSLSGRLGAGNGQIRLETGEGNIVIQGILP